MVTRILAVILVLVYPVFASPGDYSPSYKRCVSYCSSYRCPPLQSSSIFSPSNPLPGFPDSPISLPLGLRLLGWSCPDECSYQCMHHLTSLALLEEPAQLPVGRTKFAGWWEEADWTAGSALEGLPAGRAVQFHGKWPFRRFLGLQEPFSVLFSLLNLAGYLRSWRPVERETRRFPPLRGLYLGVVVLGANMWVWSTVFHARDRRWTERGDYFSAAAYNLWGLYVSLIRIFRLHPVSASPSSIPTPDPAARRRVLGDRARATLRRMLLLLVVLAFALHVTYLLSDKRFDYRYNMTANIIVSVLTLSLWCGWSLSHHIPLPSSLLRFRTTRDPAASGASPWSYVARAGPPHTLRPWLLSTWLVAVSALELLDFPPILGRSLDAHALWHLATVPLGRLWCVGFLAQDAKWEAMREREAQRTSAAR